MKEEEEERKGKLREEEGEGGEEGDVVRRREKRRGCSEDDYNGCGESRRGRGRVGASGMEVRRWLLGEREGVCGGGGYGDSGPLFTHRTLRCAPQPLNTRRMLLSSHFYPLHVPTSSVIQSWLKCQLVFFIYY